MLAHDLLYGLWALWALLWCIFSLRVKAVRREERFVSRLGHLVPLGLAAVLLALPNLPVPILGRAFLWQTPILYRVGVSLTALGIAFAVWARLVLGGNWSGTVTVKTDHELVRRGPYARIRHPIYTGLLLALAGTGLCVGEWRAVLAFMLVVASLWRKLRIEERWMEETFGEAYVAYRKETWALVPFL